MAKNIMTIRASEVAKELTMTVNVTGLKIWRVRLFVGLLLLRASTWVMGCGIELIDKKE
jgi:hypothetical protein